MNDAIFSEYKALILQGLEENRDDHLRIHDKLDLMTKEISDFKEKTNTDITVMKTKAAVYGAIPGATLTIIAVIVAAATYFKGA